MQHEGDSFILDRKNLADPNPNSIAPLVEQKQQQQPNSNPLGQPLLMDHVPSDKVSADAPLSTAQYCKLLLCAGGLKILPYLLVAGTVGGLYQIDCSQTNNNPSKAWPYVALWGFFGSSAALLGYSKYSSRVTDSKIKNVSHQGNSGSVVVPIPASPGLPPPPPNSPVGQKH